LQCIDSSRKIFSVRRDADFLARCFAAGTRAGIAIGACRCGAQIAHAARPLSSSSRPSGGALKRHRGPNGASNRQRKSLSRDLQCQVREAHRVYAAAENLACLCAIARVGNGKTGPRRAGFSGAGGTCGTRVGARAMTRIAR
jgi:hypothetical protein